MEKVTENIWKYTGASNCYLINVSDDFILIDAGIPEEANTILKSIKSVIAIDKIKMVVLTHLHYDHIGLLPVLAKQPIFASQCEVDLFKTDPFGTVLNSQVAAKLNMPLHPLSSIQGLKIINTPGHTKGSVCYWYSKQKALFSGDTLFDQGYGRTDLPTSSPQDMFESLAKLKALPYKILCPGHNY